MVTLERAWHSSQPLNHVSTALDDEQLSKSLYEIVSSEYL